MNTKLLGSLGLALALLAGVALDRLTTGKTRFVAGQLDACQKFTAQLPLPFQCDIESGQVVITTPLAPGMKVDLEGKPVQ